MTAKFVAILVGALGLGFTGTYVATNGQCSKGGCPLGNLISSMSSSSNDCCSQNAECCNPPQACCGEVKAKASCCSQGAACCNPAQACCEESKISADNETVPACCFPGSPCCEGGDCCLKRK